MHITQFRKGDTIAQTLTEKPFKSLNGQVLELVTIERGEIVLKRIEANSYTMIHLPFQKYQNGWVKIEGK